MAWGSSFLFIDIALDDLEPGMVALARVGLGAVTLAIVPTGRPSIERSDWPRLVLLGIFWLAIPETLLPVAQRWINSSIAGLLIGAVPIVTALVAALLLGRRPGVSQQIGVTLGLTGVVLISLSGIQNGGETGVAGIACVLAAMVLYGISANAVAPLQQKYGSLPVMRWVLAIGALFTLPYALVGASRSSLTTSSTGAVLVLGIVATGVAFVAYGNLIGNVGATRAAGVLYITPVIALILGVSLRGDDVTPTAYLGCVLIVLATAFVSRQGR